MSDDTNPADLPVPRRGWDRLGIVFACTFPTLVTWVYFVALAKQPESLQQAAYAVGKSIQFAFPLLFAWLVLREAIRLRRPRLRGIEWGLGFGVLVAGAMLVLYYAALKPMGFFDGPGDAVRAKIAGMGIKSVVLYAGVGVFYSLCHSLLEEYYWRWFVFRRLTFHVSLAAAIGISSIGFMAHHVIVLAQFFGIASFATWFFSLSVAVGGAVWAWVYHRSNSLYGPWLSHLLVDAAIFVVGYDLAGNLLH